MQILHPFEIGNDHPACIRQNIGNQKHTFFLQNSIRVEGGRTIGSFGENPALQALRVFFRDLHLQRGGHEYVTLELKELLITNLLTIGASFQDVAFADHFQQSFHRQPLGVIKSARPVRHSNHLDPDVGQFFCDHSADVSEALDCSRAFAEIYTQMFRRLDNRIDDAAACRFFSSQSAADGHWLAGDYLRHRTSFVLRVGIHDPRHDLFIRSHIRSGHIDIGANEVKNFSREASGHGLKLVARELRRIASDAALRSA